MGLTRVALEGVWLAGRARLALRGEHHRLPPAGPGHAAHLTSITRVPREVAERLEPLLDRLRRCDPHHYFYEPDSLHVTIRNLDGLADLRAARSAIGSRPAFDVAAHGLNLWAHTVFAPVLPADGTLAALRHDLAGLTGGSAGRLPGLAFANVVRFSGRVSRDLVRELARLRRVELGSWRVSEVELVRTDRLLSRDGTEVLDRIKLS